MAALTPFFDNIRPLFGGSFQQNQVDGLNHILKNIKGQSLQHAAYILATAFHETGPMSSNLHMTPRREIWGPTAAQNGYEGRDDLGNTQPGDGKRFMGRGYVQITGRRNYTKGSDVVGVDLVSDPDKAMEPDIAAKLMLSGMTEGWFTGKSLSDYSSYVSMRRVVNGTDKAEQIARYAEEFEDALLSVKHLADQELPPEPPIVVPPAPELDLVTRAEWVAIFRLVADRLEGK